MSQHVPFDEWLEQKRTEWLDTMPRRYDDRETDARVVEELEKRGMVK